MNARTLSVVALSNRDFDSLDAKLAEAAHWLRLAAAQGSQLAVFPETINRFEGDGVDHPRRRPMREVALHDWRRQCAPLLEAAQREGIAMALPFTHWEGDRPYNSFFLIDQHGEEIGRYDKVSPTPEELDAGFLPSPPAFFEWEGITVTGAICFDTCFPKPLLAQARKAQLLLAPSLWPGGSVLNQIARQFSLRVALAYPAWSRIIDLDGREVVAGGYRHETLRFGFGVPVFTATLNFGRVALYGNHNQQKIEAILARYGKRVSVTFDQENVLFFLETLDPDLPESVVMEEFELISAPDYFAACEQRLAAARLT